MAKMHAETLGFRLSQGQATGAGLLPLSSLELEAEGREW